MSGERIIRSDIPGRLDRLPWSRWHWRVVIALGITWVLDGLEVTVVGSLVGVLQRPDTLALSPTELGLASSSFIAGAVLGALYFGRLADQLGRKRLFLVTLVVYTVATVLTAFSFNFASFAFCRFFTGFGIGGEYAAINSAIDELIPARVRGQVDLAINGSFWGGAMLGAAVSLVLLEPTVLGADLGWRLAFGLGAVLALAILLVRRHVPESPRWLITRGQAEHAEREIATIEAEIVRQHGPLPPPTHTLTIALRPPPSWRKIFDVLLRRQGTRALLGLALMTAQAFFYNAYAFSYALVLSNYYGVADERVGAYMLPFALGNFLGPLLLGRFFDTIGRRRMIAGTYGAAAVGSLITGYAFTQGWLNVNTQALSWSATFFMASTGASAAYLTVSEIFPLEMRAVAISVFYAIGTAAGGFLAPVVFGMLIASGSRDAIYMGYIFGAALMLVAAFVALRYGVDAERKSLEEVAEPLSAAHIAPTAARHGPGGEV